MQHAPWGGDGGAEETAYGLQCLDYWLRGPAGDAIAPDLVFFNFGLHDGPQLFAAVRAASGRLSALSVFLWKSILYRAFVWARRALKRQNRRFQAPRAAACLVHDLLLQNVTSPRLTIVNGLVPPPVWSTIYYCKRLLVPVLPY